jgi:hypothetical protein
MSKRARTLLSITILAAIVGVAPTAVSAEPFVFVGLYPGALQNKISTIQDVDAWIAPTGKRVALAGTFMDWEFPNPGFNVPADLDSAWNAGYVPFVNFLSQRTLAEINSGAIDGAIATWARFFAAWAKPGKRAFLAPLAEMNGNWVSYYGKPADFIAAYRRVRQIFATALAAHNVPQNAISWVFVPNGWSQPGDEFERFYPGHNDVDVVAFSAYNYGGCPPDAPWLIWDTFDTAFKPLLDRMRATAPGKPIFIAQTGVLDKPVHGVGSKDQWLEDSFTQLAAYPGLRGIMYFELQLPSRPDLPNCPNPDFRLHLPGTDQWQGFKRALANPASNFGYWAPSSAEMQLIVFAPTVPQLFGDVFPIHPFAAEPGDVDFHSWIQKLAASGITTGCSVNPPLFCPLDAVTRAQMAAFLVRGIHGATFGPPAGSGLVFADVPAGHAFVSWIEQLARDGITTGCDTGPLRYCPDGIVTRAQMAVFLLRSEHGAQYQPPAATGTVFADVPKNDPFAPWIERLAAEGITGGCSGANYCPTAVVTRAQMAVFLVRPFGL